MKIYRLMYLFGIIVALSTFSLSAQSKKEKAEQKRQEVKELIDSKQFTINIDRALPSSGRALNLTSAYSLAIHGDSVRSHLPYFGRAYNVPYGGSGGVMFEETVSDYELSYDKKGTAKIKYKVKTKDDDYTFNVQIFINGSASVNVTPVNKQGISYQGELAEKK